MNHTIAQQRGAHLHFPWVPVLLVLVAIAAAAAILVLVNQPATSPPPTGVGVGAAEAPDAAVVTMPEDIIMRRQLIEQAALRAQASDTALAKQAADRAWLGTAPTLPSLAVSGTMADSGRPSVTALAKQAADRPFVRSAASAAGLAAASVATPSSARPR